jgi:hypothetical protein
MISSMVRSRRFCPGIALHGDPARRCDTVWGDLSAPRQDDDLVAELGHFHHIVGNVEKTGFRKGRFNFIQDGLAGGFIHIGQTFVHDEDAEVLEKIPQQVHPVALPHGELGVAHAHEF